MFRYVFNLFGESVWYDGFILRDGLAFYVPLLLLVAVIISAYLIGAVNSALIVSKLCYNEDIRSKGSGNAGTTNMMRAYGKGPAIMTLVGDMLKTMLGMAIGTSLLGLNGAYVAGLFCVLGHIAPVYYRFKGGKGVASTAMVVLYLDWVVFLICFLLFVLIVWATKYISLASIICELVMPLILNQNDRVPVDRGFRLIISLILGLTVVYMHRANIRRIMNKEESKFEFKKTKRRTVESVQSDYDTPEEADDTEDTETEYAGDEDGDCSEKAAADTGKPAVNNSAGRPAKTVHKSGKKKKGQKK